MQLTAYKLSNRMYFFIETIISNQEVSYKIKYNYGIM